jgi:hypothetical protein
MRFLGKEKMEKLPGKLENSEKTESAFFYRIFVMSWQSFQEKKNWTITKESWKIRTNCKNYNFCMHFRS